MSVFLTVSKKTWVKEDWGHIDLMVPEQGYVQGHHTKSFPVNDKRLKQRPGIENKNISNFHFWNTEFVNYTHFRPWMHNSKYQGIISFPFKNPIHRPQTELVYGAEWQWKTSLYLPLLCPPPACLANAKLSRALDASEGYYCEHACQQNSYVIRLYAVG
jgi:hypothetical protein